MTVPTRPTQLDRVGDNPPKMSPAGEDGPDSLSLGREAFGPAFELAQTYAALLTGRAMEWGLLGPREGGRVWTRHLLNSVVLAACIPESRRVADVGSGAGLPGIPLAIARPDLRVTLVESLERRARFLRLAVEELGLADRVDVEHGRAEQLSRTFDTVVSRAVAPLPILIPWCLRLTDIAGEVLAMRGSHVEGEVASYLQELPEMLRRVHLRLLPALGADEPVRVVQVTA